MQASPSQNYHGSKFFCSPQNINLENHRVFLGFNAILGLWINHGSVAQSVSLPQLVVKEKLCQSTCLGIRGQCAGVSPLPPTHGSQKSNTGHWFGNYCLAISLTPSMILIQVKQQISHIHHHLLKSPSGQCTLKVLIQKRAWFITSATFWFQVHTELSRFQLHQVGFYDQGFSSHFHLTDRCISLRKIYEVS